MASAVLGGRFEARARKRSGEDDAEQRGDGKGADYASANPSVLTHP